MIIELTKEEAEWLNKALEAIQASGSVAQMRDLLNTVNGIQKKLNEIE